MLTKYSNGIYSYSLATHGLLNGDFVRTCHYEHGTFYSYAIGYTSFLFWLSSNNMFFNIELKPKSSAIYSRSAGTYCTILRKNDELETSTIRLPTGKLLVLSSFCLVTLGRCSNFRAYKQIVGSAGKNRLNNIRPTVRGVAMNPVDHPHGGRTKTNVPERTPWGRIAKITK